MSDTFWSKEKVGVIFAGFTALTAVTIGGVGSAVILGMQETTARLDACVSSGAEWKRLPDTAYYECVRD